MVQNEREGNEGIRSNHGIRGIHRIVMAGVAD